jgi:predicted metal-dependent hydrolase
MLKIEKIIRTNRKTIAIGVDYEGKLFVRAPHRTSKKMIQQVVDNHSNWIQEKQEEANQRLSQLQRITFSEGDRFLYLGNYYPLVYVNRSQPPLILNGKFELSKTQIPQAEQNFISWYRDRAKEVFKERADIIAANNGFKYTRIWVTKAQKRWGSCNSENGLNFNWKLVMAPIEVIDYVVIHELVHTEFRNHSRDFWKRVESVYPGFRDQVKWLKAYGFLLDMKTYIKTGLGVYPN